jgi:HK97 family phage major capsid protein
MLRTGSESKMLEFRAMSVGSLTDGGYLVPDDLLNRVAEYEDAALGVNFLVTEYAASRPFHIARETNRPTVSGVAEVGSYLEVGATTDVITFSPFKLGRIIKVSEELVMDSVVSLDTFLARKLGQGASIEKSRLFLSGTGSSQPEGILTSCTEGSTGGAISATALNTLMFSVPQAFRMSGAWVGHSTALSAIRALSVADNASPYWTLSLQPGEPDRLMGKPIYEDDNMPTHANGNKVLLFGDFATYEVATFMPPTIQRLVELYAGTGQVGFRYTERFDGHPTNVRAIAWHRRTS